MAEIPVAEIFSFNHIIVAFMFYVYQIITPQKDHRESLYLAGCDY